MGPTLTSAARALLGLASLGLGVACSAEELPVTELVLVVDSDLPASAFERVEIVVRKRDGTPVTFPASASAPVELPLQLGLLHEGGSYGPVTVIANGRLKDGGLVATRTHEVYFAKNQTLAVPLHLFAACFRAGSGGGFEPSVDPCWVDLANKQFACEGDVCRSECSEGGACIAEDLDQLPSWPIEAVADDGSLLDGGAATDGGNPGDGDGDAQPPPVGDAGTDGGVQIMTCDGTPVDVLSDPKHCGRCDTDCTLDDDPSNHLVGVCDDGSCKLDCEPGRGDCDTSDGVFSCSVDTNNDEAHCGGCGMKCQGAMRECRNGDCVMK